MPLRLKENISGNLSGNASTATQLQTARTLTIGSTGKSFDGSGNVSWSLAEIGAATSSHTHSNYASTSWYTATMKNGWSTASFGTIYGGDKPLVATKVGNILIIQGCIAVGTKTAGTTVADFGYIKTSDGAVSIMGYGFYGSTGLIPAMFRFTTTGSLVLDKDICISSLPYGASSGGFILINAVVSVLS